MRPYYLYDGDQFTGNMASLYWICLLIESRKYTLFFHLTDFSYWSTYIIQHGIMAFCLFKYTCPLCFNTYATNTHILLWHFVPTICIFYEMTYFSHLSFCVYYHIYIPNDVYHSKSHLHSMQLELINLDVQQTIIFVINLINAALLKQPSQSRWVSARKI